MHIIIHVPTSNVQVPILNMYMCLHAMYMYMYLHAMYITYVLLLLSAAVIEFMGKAGGHLGGSNCNIPQIHLLI